MFNVRLAGGHLYGKQLFTWLSLVVSLMASFVLSFFPLDVLDEIWDLIESVSEGFLSYSFITTTCKNGEYKQLLEFVIQLEQIKRTFNSGQHAYWVVSCPVFTFWSEVRFELLLAQMKIRSGIAGVIFIIHKKV